MREMGDDNDVITIRVDGVNVDSVVVRNRWRSYYDATTLAAQIKALLKQAIANSVPTETSEMMVPVTGRWLGDAEIRYFWEQFALYRRKRELYIAKVLSRGIPERPQTEETADRQRHIGASYVGGRFNDLGIDPAWLESTPMQTVSEQLTKLLSQRPLIVEAPIDPDRSAMEQHLGAIYDLLAGR